MADSTITVARVVLFDPLAFAASDMFGLPADGFIGASHHNVAAPAYELGRRIVVPNVTTGNKGFSVFSYLKAVANAGVALAAGQVCVPDALATGPHVVTNDPDDCIAISIGTVAVCLSAMTTLYYGWFWTGGVCPQDVALFNGAASPLTTKATLPTDDSVVAGPIKAVDLTADAIGFAAVSHVTTLACGMALAADGA